MTEDYKSKLLSWLTGNYNITSGSNIPQFKEPITLNITNDITTFLTNEFPDGYTLTASINNIYFGYDTNNKGFALITDKFNAIQIIKQYIDGTDLGVYKGVGVGDDGNYFGIETINGVNKFVLLNNIKAKLPTQENYQIVKREVYDIPNNTHLSNFIVITGIKKSPASARYLVCGSYDYNYIDSLFATQIVISNDATYTDYTYIPSNPYFGYDFIANWDNNNNLSLSIVGIEYGANILFGLYELDNGSIVRHQLGSAISGLYTGSIAITDTNDIYIATSVSSGGSNTYSIYKVDTSNYSLNSIYSKNGVSLSGPDTTSIILKRINQELFYMLYTNKDATPTKQIYYVGKVIGSNVYEYELGEYNPTTPEFAMQKEFNLYDYYVKISNNVYDIKQIYNSLNYNGLPYTALNSMIPNSINLYDDDGFVIFARNLYNRIVNANTTTSTIEIPNIYLNDIIIELKELISETNNVMTTDNKQIETNIYEQLLINFINTINMENQNDLNNIIVNDTGASRINNSVSNLKDYSNAKATKYRVHYQNNTSAVYNMSWTSIGNYYKGNMSISNDANNPVTSIDIISNDETTIYQTIDCTGLDTDKMYSVTQDVYIDEKEE